MEESAKKDWEKWKNVTVSTIETRHNPGHSDYERLTIEDLYQMFKQRLEEGGES